MVGAGIIAANGLYILHREQVRKRTAFAEAEVERRVTLC